MKNNPYIDKVLIAYFKGQANADDTNKLLEWLDRSPENKKRFEIIQNFWNGSEYKVAVKDQDQAFEKIKEKISSPSQKSSDFEKLKEKRKVFTLGTGFRVLAAATLIFTITISFIYLKTSVDKSYLSEEAATYIKSENRSGEKSRIRLSDGTIVWLNSKSILEYPKEFVGTERHLILEGEAFFEVAKDTLRPFKVTSGNITTTALGTSFNVQFFEEDDELVITLITGKVEVALQNQEKYVLEPGYQILYNRIENTATKKQINQEFAIAWKEGVLLFDKDRYTEVTKKLERWYGVNIQTKGAPPSDFVITGQFRRNESLEMVLETLNYGRQFHYSITGKEIEIIFN